MAVKGTLVGLSSTELTEIRTAAVTCIIASSVRGVSYSIAGRSFSFPSLESAQDLIQECNFASGLLSGARTMNVRANFNRSIGRGTANQ